MSEFKIKYDKSISAQLASEMSRFLQTKNEKQIARENPAPTQERPQHRSW